MNILENVARNPDGTYRVVAGRQLPGKILGGYQYAGTRPDDPNDSCRTSTGASCRRCASSARGRTSPTSRPRTRSTLVTENGKIVKHYLQDVGSTFGMCNDFTSGI